jgi:hypothetical protein
MKIKGIIDEDFINYKKPSMVIMCSTCSFKCDKECGEQVCQNSALATSPDIQIDNFSIVDRYLKNPITKAIVFSGLEPFDSFEDMYSIVYALRQRNCTDDIVIYTGYDRDEISTMKRADGFFYIDSLILLRPIIVKYGRYKPNQKMKYDEVLGVNLASDNQYAVRYE